MNQNITEEELKNYEELIDIGNEENKPDHDKLNKLLGHKNKFSCFKRYKLGKLSINIIIPVLLLMIIIYFLIKYISSYNATFKLIKVKSKKELIQKAGDIIIETIQNNINPKISLTTGGLPKNIYKYLIDKYEEKEISFVNTTFFNLYEYCGLDQNSKKSNSYYIKDNLFDHIDINENNIYLINSFGESCEENVDKYKEVLNRNEIDLQLINIDDEFNLGINGPGVALESKTHIAQLSEIRKNDIAERFDIEIKDAPKEGITQGIDDIIKSKIILVVAEGKQNAEGLKNIMKGKVDIEKPSSTLKNHVGIVYIVADEDACSLL